MSLDTTPIPPAARPLRQDAGLIGLVGLAHLCSHFSQLLLAPLFPWLKDAFNVSYTELGFLMTVFFVVSCATQAASGFVVDRHGPRPVLFAGLALLSVGAFGFSMAPSYGVMALFAVVAGVGNGVFHPVDFTILNRKVSAPRLGHAYSVHGLTGNLGWALAPALLVPVAVATSWRTALAVAGGFVLSVLVLLWVKRDRLHLPPLPAHAPADGKRQAHGHEGSFAFLRIPAVWMCFFFFLLFAFVLSVVQAFAPTAARHLHDVPLGVAAMCLTIYMVCGAGGMLVGGFLASDPARIERILAAGVSVAAVVAFTVALAPVPAAAVPVMFGIMGLATGLVGPSRDLIVKRSTPPHASGRVYGVVYAGLDIGQAIAPLVFGSLMDHQQYQGVWLGLGMAQLALITTGTQVRKARRTTTVAAAA